MNFDYATLERRIAALEASQSASLRFGRVTSIEGGKTRVELADGQKTVSYDLSTVQSRVLRDQEIKMPDIGEPVACLFSGQGNEQGVVLGAYYNGEENDPGQPQRIDYRRYEDGTELWYDRETHKLVAKVKGDCEIEAEKKIVAKAKEDIEIETEQKASVRAKSMISLQSDECIKINAPVILLEGMLNSTDADGSPGKGVLSGNFVVRNGDVTIPESDATAGAVSLRQHLHEGVESGSSVTQKPVGG